MPPPFFYCFFDMSGNDDVLVQPNADDERLLNAVVEDSVDVVVVRGRKFRIGWLRNRTKRKITDILLNEADDDKVNSKCAAAIVLNGFFKIWLLYWFLWRWFYYVMQYGDAELLPVIEMGKKKVRLEHYCAATILLTDMRDTVMMMTREEVGRIRQESIGALRGR